MDCRDNAKESHGCEEQGSKRTVFACRKSWREQCDDGEDAHGCYATKVDELPQWITLEDVVNWWEKGGDDHDCYSCIVYLQ